MMRDIKRKLRKARAAEVYEDGRSVRKVEKLTLPELTTAPAFPEWRRKFRDAVKEAAGRHYDEAWRWILELERPDIQLEDLADSGRFPLLDNALSAAITRAAAKVTVGFDIGQKEGRAAKARATELPEGPTKGSDGLPQLPHGRSPRLPVWLPRSLGLKMRWRWGHGKVPQSLQGCEG